MRGLERSRRSACYERRVVSRLVCVTYIALAHDRVMLPRVPSRTASSFTQGRHFGLAVVRHIRFLQKYVPGASLAQHRTHQVVPDLDMSGILFMLVWSAVLAIILYSLVNSCLRRNYPPTGNTQRVPPPTYPGPGGGGRSGYGYFPSDFQSPPPPYTKDPSSTEGWRPGFWSGAALGALGGSLLNRSQSLPRAYDWERSDSRYGSAQRRASFYGDGDRREGPSNLGPLRTSTGYAGSSSR